jgi:hypothetical protein
MDNIFHNHMLTGSADNADPVSSPLHVKNNKK